LSLHSYHLLRSFPTRRSSDLRSSSSPTSASFILCCPSKKNGFVTTATVNAPISFEILATIGAAPVPVPPPSPQVIKTMSAPFTRSEEHTSELQSLRHLVCRLL